MKILGIETSCDETALAVIEAGGDFSRPASPKLQRGEPQFKILAEALNSQTKIHEKYGGVFPMMAKREHATNLIPLLKKLVVESGLGIRNQGLGIKEKEIREIFEREPELAEQFLKEVPKIARPDIDAIAVTVGPGLEPALWVGINFARALGLVWNLPVVPTNHMEGHIMSALLPESRQADSYKLIANSFSFPAAALLISGGHTELVLMKNWRDYKILGETRDDAVGEAFDKVARMLELPYPGGPEISKLAEEARHRDNLSVARLPRPMIKSDDYDFSFAGLKTSVLYTIRKMTPEQKQNPSWKPELAREFEDAVTEVFISKVSRAIKEFNIKTLIVGGGVIANQHLRLSFEKLMQNFPDTQLLIPDPKLSTDNAVMIAMAGYFNYLSDPNPLIDFKASGNLKLV